MREFLERMESEMSVCVCLDSAESKREREKKRWLAWEYAKCMDVWVLLHGNPLNNCEVAHTKPTPHSFGLGPRMERERGDFWAFCP